MSTHAHLDTPRCEPDHAGMDDMAKFSLSYLSRPVGVHRAQPLPAEWPTRRAFVPQGCDQQGRVEPTIKSAEPFPVVPDRLPEDFDQPEPLTLKESVSFWVFALSPGIALVGVVGAYIWARFGHVW